MSVTRRSRQTGTEVTTGRAEELGCDPDGGAWVTICDAHGYLINSDTRHLAQASKPLDFCDGCRWLHSTQEFTEYQADQLERDFGHRIFRGDCDGCEELHEAQYVHHTNGQMVYAVTCPLDGLTTYVTREGLDVRL